MRLRLGLILTPLVLLASTDPSLAVSRRVTGCVDGGWLLDAKGVFPEDDADEQPVLTIAQRRVAVDGACGPRPLRTKRRDGAIVVKARWRACGGLRLVTLRARVDASACRRMTGELDADAAPPVAFTAERAVRVLVFSRTTGFRHPSIADAQRVLGALGPRDGVVTTLTEDPAQFTDETLAGYDVVLFANTTGDVLDDGQQAALERFVRAGKGWVGVHSAADTEYGWPWYGRLVGAYFRNHPLLPVEVTVTTEDATHPSTAHLPPTFRFVDEIYNFDRNPRGDNAILLTIDESGFVFPNFPPGPSMGEDHPVAWYKEFEGGRSFYTNLGHRPETWDDPRFRAHLLAGIRWAAGPITWSTTVLTDDARNPMSLAVAPDGRVYWTERTGDVRLWDPRTGAVSVALALDVDTTAENGLLGIVLDPAFAANGWLYVYHSTPVNDPPPPSGPPGENVLSRFTARADGTLDPASRTDLLRVPSERQCCHEGGGLAFGPDGTLFVSTGDNTDPFSAGGGYAPLDERPGRERWNSQRTAQNPFDLRGKILRIRPDGSIPPGNLFPPDGSAGRPEVFTMGSRNPFRIAVDPQTGRLWWGEVGPDAIADSSRGPRGFDEINLADSPGNYGWPWCIADDRPYADWDFAADSATGVFTCDGLRPATLFYDYVTVSHLALGNAVSPETGLTGRTAIAGTVYRRPTGGAPFALPPPWADTLLMTDWTRDVLASVDVDAAGALRAVRRLLPWEHFHRPIDLEVGPDGALYVLEYGTGYFGDNLDARVTRVEYADAGHLTPVAVLDASATAGAAPLTVQFSGERSRAPGLGDEIARWEWDFDGDGRIDARGPTAVHTYRRPGANAATLRVTTALGARSLPVSRRVLVGNAVPEVAILEPADGTRVPAGSIVRLRGSVRDAEDGVPPCGSWRWDIFLGHNAHSHPQFARTGCEVTFPATVPESHGDETERFLAVEHSSADGGGPGGVPSATGRAGVRLFFGPPQQGSPGGAFVEG